jgi:hypothetical protein
MVNTGLESDNQMPLQKGSSQKVISGNIAELHHGNTYAKTAAKFGKERANKQSVAIAFSEAKGRAFGGIAPQMGGMLAQASNPVMLNNTAGSGSLPQTIPQPPVNAQTSGIAPPAMMGAPNGLNAGMPGLNAGIPGPAGARPFAFGGGVNPAPKTFKGPIVSAVPGRTDLHHTQVPSGAYVIPADIVSGHGQGNTLAGMQTLHKLFKLGAHPIGSIHPSAGMGNKFAKGGKTDNNVGRPVEVILAGGEIVVPPENVHETMQRICKKKLTLDECHKAMDAWVVNQRKKLVKTLKKLPPPAKD